MRIGIDVGGTFTDVVLIDDQTGRIHYTKTLTTPANRALGVIEGLQTILELASAQAGQIDTIVHGTTTGTNALIERKGARTGLVTTAGFRDVLEIARIERPAAGLYDIFVDLPAPLVPRYLRVEVDERVGASGEIVRPLDEASARQAITYLKTQGVEAIAICLIFGFRNPVHEQRLRELCREILPGVSVSLASEIAPEFREYERTSTAVINAYLQPVIEHYLDNLAGELARHYGQVDLRIMQASGGSMTVEDARDRAVNMVNSGPAGGALAAAYVGQRAGDEQIVGVDMGGTSFDIGLIVGGEPRTSAEGEFEGYPVKIPMIDVHAIGAGGGSLAWIDRGGALNVGPESAGADPGPACYGRGDRPTVTDANLVLGRLNPAYFLGGAMKLDIERARQAIREHVAEPLGLSVEAAAAGIIRVVNANMTRGINTNTVEKGLDVRNFTLLPYGGAGPIHAVDLAQELGMQRVIVPPYPGTLSALGLLVANTRYDYVATLAVDEDQVVAADLEVRFAGLEVQGRAQLQAQHVPADRIRLVRSADMRYTGQSYELNTPFPDSDPLNDEAIRSVIDTFHELHYRVYAYGSVDEKVEFVNLRLAAIGLAPEVKLGAAPVTGGADPVKGHHPVYFFGHDFVDTPTLDRTKLAPGAALSGPCLVEEPASTTVIPPGARAWVDKVGSLIIEWG
ncbi:MAG TPA: hydantoinase/oxoprolinase family protein [Anaerolineae bacterium]